jgi:hypothetical protein
MWLTIVILVAAFASLVALLAFSFQEVQHDRERDGDAVPATGGFAKPGHCMLCDAPVRRPCSHEQVVLEVQQRIDAELREVSQLVEQEPGSVARQYAARA